MKTTIATRFRRSSPLTHLNKLTLMFLTLILQYLNKLIEGKVGNLTPPQAFHAVKVQSFKDNRIKLLAKFAGELPVKVFALVADLPIETCESSNTSPLAVRTFLFTTQRLVERPKFLQVRFQRLWVLYLFTRGKCQICVFHTEVRPNAFTCCWQGSKIFVGRRDTKPISTATITLYRNLANRSMPLAVLVKSICDFIKLPFTCLWIPLAKTQGHTIIIQRPTSRTRIRKRLKLTSRLNMRSTPKFLKETVIRLMNTLEFLLHNLARQGVPMRVGRLFQQF